MTAITIRFFAQFREMLGERIQLVVPEATTITEAVQIVCRERKEATDALFGEDGAFREYVILMQNGTRVNRTEAASTVVADGDELAVFPPVAGG